MYAGFFRILSFEAMVSMYAAPFKSSSIFTPAAASGSKPAGESTEKSMGTFSGIAKVWMPRAAASPFSSGLSLPAVIIMWSLTLFLPAFASISFQKTFMDAVTAGSPPCPDTTHTSVFFMSSISMSSAPDSGSAPSTANSLSPFLLSCGIRLCNGCFTADRTAFIPSDTCLSASTTTFSNLSLAASAAFLTSSFGLGSYGRYMKPSCPSSLFCFMLMPAAFISGLAELIMAGVIYPAILEKSSLMARFFI